MEISENDRRYLPPRILNKLIEYLGDVMFVLLGGSHLTETEDEQSDRDFVAVTKTKSHLEYGQVMLSLNNLHLDQGAHCTLFVQSISNFYDIRFNHYVSPLVLHFVKVRREDLLYENPEYKTEIDELFKNQIELGRNAAVQTLFDQSKLVNDLIECYTYSKWHYHLFFAWEIISGEHIPRELLKNMKRGRVPEMCIKYLKKISCWLSTNECQ